MRDRQPILISLAERPEFAAQIYEGPIQETWPLYMRQDPTAELYFEPPWSDAHADTAFALVDPAEPDVAVGRAFAVRFAFGAEHGRPVLPDSGWDGVIRWAHQDLARGVPANALSLLEITLTPAWRGRGGSRIVLDALRRFAGALGVQHMVAPVRPTGKHLEPFTPMATYVARQGADGLPADPWLRVHIRAGGVIEKIAPASMVVAGSIADWAAWTGARFTASGPVAIPGALVPVQVALAQDQAVYVEPNVWVRHSVIV
jgi:GNAT superfamily N-acetyltransferase